MDCSRQAGNLGTGSARISEALVATAIGLFAAIPAVIAYNRFNTKVDSLAMTYENFSDEFAAIHIVASISGVNNGTCVLSRRNRNGWSLKSMSFRISM